MNRARPSIVTAAALLLLQACAGDSSSDRPPGDDVVDESAGEDAIAVLTGKAPGVAVIVEYTEGADVDSVTDDLGADYDLNITSRYHEVFPGAAFIAPDDAAVAALTADPRVLTVTPDELVSADSITSAADSELPGAIEEAEAAGEMDTEGGSAGGDADDEVRTIKQLTPEVQSTGWRLIRGGDSPGDGRGMTVAVIDSGIDLHHPDLAPAIHSSLGKDCVRRKNKTLQDQHGHGTHVSGIIAAQHNGFGTVGIAPAARIVPVRVLDGENAGTDSTVLCGVDYVMRHTGTIDAVNMSIQHDCGQACSNFDETPKQRAIKKLIRRDVFVAICAGNFGTDARWSDPGFIEEGVTVSNYADFNGKMSSTDHYRQTSGFGAGVDIGAPGTHILSTWVSSKGKHVYNRITGCSMATPLVTGAAAVYKQVYGGGPAKIRQMLLEDARTSYPGRGGDHPERLLLMRGQGGPNGTGCGDGVCQGDETDATCGADCGCDAALDCNDVAPFGCYCDPGCGASKDCCADAAQVCPAP
ncbi:MAG TPA: S8 family serine peptidase [Kofleriaceae bacterium]|nr:S8 family serine peptidase [Kofleriaceae bacterium]